MMISMKINQMEPTLDRGMNHHQMMVNLIKVRMQVYQMNLLKRF